MHPFGHQRSGHLRTTRRERPMGCSSQALPNLAPSRRVFLRDESRPQGDNYSALRAALMKTFSVNKSVMKNRGRSLLGKKVLQPIIVDVGLDRRGGKAADGSLRILRRHVDRELALLLF